MTNLPSFVVGFIGGQSGEVGKVVYDTAFAGKASAEDLTLAVEYMRRHVQAHVIPGMGQSVLGNRSSSEGRIVQDGFCDECHGTIVVDRHGERVCESCGLIADLANPLSEMSPIDSAEDDGEHITETGTDLAGSQGDLFLSKQRDLSAEARRARVVFLVRAGYNTVKALNAVLKVDVRTLRADRKVLMDAGILTERVVGRVPYLSYVASSQPRRVPARTVEPVRIMPEPVRLSSGANVWSMAYVSATPHAHLYGTYRLDVFFFAGRMYPAATGR